MNKDLLQETVKNSGLRTSFIVEQMGMTPTVWHSRINGRSKFKVEEAIRLKNLLDLPDGKFERIFFA